MSKYFAFLFLLFFSPLLSTEQSITPYLTSENDTLSIVDGLVNAYNGKVVQIDKDLEIQGTDPLELIRYYDSNFYLLSRWGSRIGLSLPVLLVFNPRTETHNVIVEQRGSSSLIFNAKKQANKRYEGKIEPDFMKFGYTNCCEALLRGEPDLSSMKVSGTEKEFIVDLGNGVKRYYKFFKKKKKEHLFRLESEDLASGNRRFYEYEKKDSSHFTRVWTTNKQCTLTLNWINISYDKKVNTITASNGHTVRYIMEKGKGLFHWRGNIAIEATSDLLKLVSGSHLIDTQYNFVVKAPRQADLFTIKTLKRPADRSFDITYNVDQKVQHVSSSGISTPLYMFFYSPNHTDVKDAQGQTRRYTFDQRRLIKLEEPHRVQHYQWNERGQLVTHTLTGENNQTMSKREYCYDALGNITETKVSGRIKQKDSQDTYSVRYNYSQDGRSNLLSENHNNEKEITYSYSPESNLISRKLTFVNQKCVEREFSEYDENAILIRKIIDDGDASDRDDLTHVSTRRITEIEPQLEAQLFGMTHPKIIKEWYDDPKSGTHALLKMVEKIYTVGDLVAEERVYDAEQHYRYSLFFEYNSKGELIRETDALGGSTVYAYDANGNKVREERLGSGKKTIYCFDTANRLIQEFKEHSNSQTLATIHTYDAIGNRIGTTNHLGQKTTFQYDAAQREISTTDPLGHSESKEYNSLGHMTVQTDKEGHVTKTVSNLYGSPLEIQYTDGTIKSLFYNLEGHLIQTIERDGTSTSYEIDYKGRPTKEKIYGSDGAFLKETLKSYRGSNTISETDSLGNTTFFEYDGAGRKVIEKIGDHIICYAYDSLGRLSTVKTAESLEIKEYDLLDRIVEERIEDHFGNVYKKIQSTYDLNGNCIAQKVYSDPQNFSETQILYNSENLPIAKIDAEGNQTTLLYHYTNQLVKEIIDPLGRKTVEFYDLANRLETIFKYGSDHQLLSHVQFAYDRKGNKTMQKERVLLEAQDLGAYAISFTYNGFDQKLSETEQNVKTTQYTYENAPPILPMNLFLRHMPYVFYEGFLCNGPVLRMVE